MKIIFIIFVVGQDEGYTVKYSPLLEGVPKGKARGNSRRQRAIFDSIFQVESKYEQYIFLKIIMVTSYIALKGKNTCQRGHNFL